LGVNGGSFRSEIRLRHVVTLGSQKEMLIFVARVVLQIKDVLCITA
jgi:hypothetical protein